MSKASMGYKEGGEDDDDEEKPLLLNVKDE